MLAAIRPASMEVCLIWTRFFTLRVRTTGTSSRRFPISYWETLLAGTPPMYSRRVYA